MENIILESGLGKSLYPLTKVKSNQLSPIYYIQMIYYQMSVSINAGSRNTEVMKEKFIKYNNFLMKVCGGNNITRYSYSQVVTLRGGWSNGCITYCICFR